MGSTSVYELGGSDPKSLLPHRKEEAISSKLFVGNLSYDTTQDEIEALFTEVGDIKEVFLPADRMTGRPRGFAFVEYEDELNAAEAIRKFDGHDLKGRTLRVSEASTGFTS